ncbi:hypothetical protein FRC07_007168, partial [Ceratobasidium sp. 392]
ESRKHAMRMPHPLREIAGTRPIYSIPVIVFMDDVSGAKTTQWNKHMCSYMQNGAIPREKLQSEFHVRFVTTSTHATPLELMQGIRKSFDDAFKSPIVAYDVELQEEVLLRPWPLFWPGDNPMQAEASSCAPLNSNRYCRTCHVGGTQTYQESNEGFAEVFKVFGDHLRGAHIFTSRQPGRIREPQETISSIHRRLELATQPNSKTKVADTVTATGVKDTLAQLTIDRLLKIGKSLRESQDSSGTCAHAPHEIKAILDAELKSAYSSGCFNPLLDMPGVDMHLDTPTEILHTVLLGIVKYFWGQTVHLLEKSKNFDTFQCRLNSIEVDGLNIPAVRADYICQYTGSLIGKHFKTISQVIAFTVYDLIPRDLLNAWLLIGRLVVLLWHTSIPDVTAYLVDIGLTILQANGFVEAKTFVNLFKYTLTSLDYLDSSHHPIRFLGIPMTPTLEIARVEDLLCCKNKLDDSDTSYFAVLRVFAFEESRHELLDMPKLSQTDKICFCELKGNAALADSYQYAKSAKPLRATFILNTSSLHNYEYIQHVLPQGLRERMPIKYDRAALRKHAAERIRLQKGERAAVKLKKARETAERTAKVEVANRDESSDEESVMGADLTTKRKGKEREYQPEDETPIRDLNTITLALLKTLARMHGLSVSGAKAKLVSTLQSFYALYAQFRALCLTA